MASFQKFNDFAEQVLKGVHNFSAHAFKVALTNTAPSAANAVLADITQIAATGGYVAGGYALDSVVLSEAAGTAKVVIADEVITATGGSVGPFRYAVVFNDTATSPADALVGFYDYGSSITLADTESLTIDFDAAAGVLALA
ncbi:hypothetical protein HHL21_12210 [Massilia sp. RP-1-19]|uniref:Uncharacterized protein n=1 Tax=Massilia polaris TaxID=2728846 RepID=A0A848HKR7_9BURK|nr:hypothetical protein [Massilia polaris]NML61824.1 hypothetical protein [Massilia polaris]